MKLQALQRAAELPVVIAQEAFNKNHQLGEYLGTSKQLRKVASYTRAVKLNKHPTVDPNNRFFEIDVNFSQIKEQSVVLMDWEDRENNQRILILGTSVLFKQLCNEEMEYQHDDDGPGRSAGYGCDTCARVFGSTRGLNIHKAAHKKSSMKVKKQK